MSLEDEVTRIMNEALKGNPDVEKALADGTSLISDVGSDHMVSMMESMIMGNRNAIICLSRYIDMRDSQLAAPSL